jgi:hypothetical protein
VSWSNAYYIKSFQEAIEHHWDLSGIKMIGAWPGHPDSMADRLFSPNFVYHQINAGMDEGSFYTDNVAIICNIGAATWQTFPYSDLDVTSWPTETAWREAPLYRGEIPDDSKYGTSYCITVTSDAEIDIIKTLLSNDIPVSISINSGQYAALSEDDVWDAASYPPPPYTDHANTIVGYFDQ